MFKCNNCSNRNCRNFYNNLDNKCNKNVKPHDRFKLKDIVKFNTNTNTNINVDSNLKTMFEKYLPESF